MLLEWLAFGSPLQYAVPSANEAALWIARQLQHVLVISRDLLVLATALHIAFSRAWDSFKKMTARASGKLATAGQFVLFLLVPAAPDLTFYALLFASLCSGLSAIDYGRLFVKELAARNHSHG